MEYQSHHHQAQIRVWEYSNVSMDVGPEAGRACMHVLNKPRRLLSAHGTASAAAAASADKPYVTVGPLSDFDGPLDTGVGFQTCYALSSAGLAAVRRNLRPDRLGAAATIQIRMPIGLDLFSAATVLDNTLRSRWHQLQEGSLRYQGD